MNPSLHRFSRFFISLLLGLALSAVCLTTRLRAATLTVINTNDSGAGSLRQAIADAASGDTITFAVTGTILLTTGELTINKDLTIQGPGANLLDVRRNAAAAFRIFTINSGKTVSIVGLTISNGSAIEGGGIINFGTLSLSRCVISGNAATVGGNGGGGIQNRATLNVDQCTISGNSAQFTGGGIAMINGGTAIITNSTISGNSTQRDGGGLTAQGVNTAANVTLINCTVSGNTAATVGGGILNVSSGASTTVNLINCTIAGNNAPGGSGIGNFVNSSTATLTLKNSIVANNLGSAQFAKNAAAVTTSLGYNLVSDSSLAPAAGDQLNTHPLLAPLGNNGGPTQTHALLFGSPAIDKGLNSGQPTDQRGFARTVDFPSLANATGGDGTDIGAFEFEDSTPRVSDTKAGSVLVFPYYTSTIGGGSDTRITISNLGATTANLFQAENVVVLDPATYVHLFLIDGTTCQQADFFLCLTPNASFSFKTSEYDPGNTGYLLAVAVNNQGVPIRNNGLIGNAFVNTPQFADNYGAEAFWANSATVATVTGNTATLLFDNVGYDAVPKQFAVEIQSPLDAAGQLIVTAGLSGDLTTGQVTGAAQVGTGQAFNEKEVFASFNGWLTGTCQARATISTASPRVPNGLGNLIKTGQAGSLKFNVGGAAGLLLTPRTATWKGIRTLHKTQTVATTLTIPIFIPVC